MINIDLTTLTDQEVIELRASVQREEQRRYQLSQAEERHLEMAREFAKAANRKKGAEWVEPRAPFQSYLKGDQVSYEGEVWESTTNLNMAPPGQEGWKKIEDYQPQTEPKVLPPNGEEWVEGVEYPQGHIVKFDGILYEANHDKVLNSPTDYPAGWTVLMESPS